MTTLFRARHNWATPYVERWSYLTDPEPSEDGTERRPSLRVIPTRQDALAVTAAGPDMQRLDALVTAGQAEAWLVPYWPGVTALESAASAGSAVALDCATDDRGFTVAGSAILWREGRTPETVTVSSRTSTTLTVATLAADWPVGTLVIPGLLARWAGDAQMGRPSTRLATLPATFDVEGLTNPGIATPSVALFDVARFTRRAAPSDASLRRVTRITSPTSRFQDYARTTTPQGQRHTAPLWLPTRASAMALLDWFHGVKGQCGAFTLPTYQADLTVTAGLGTASLTVTAIGYTARLFPLGTRSALVGFAGDGTMTERTVTDAVDNGDGTETLTLSAAMPADTIQVSYRLTVRLASDTLELRWLAASVAECVLDVVEVAA